MTRTVRTLSRRTTSSPPGRADRPALHARHRQHPVPRPRILCKPRAERLLGRCVDHVECVPTPSTGPPSRIRPSSTRPFMNCACSAHSACSRMSFDQSHGPAALDPDEVELVPSGGPPSHDSRVGVAQVGSPALVVARTGGSASTPRARDDGAELPHAERRTVGSLERPRAGRGRRFRRPSPTPSPRARSRCATCRRGGSRSPRRSGAGRRSRARRGPSSPVRARPQAAASHRPDRERHGLLVRSDVVPLEDRVAEREARLGVRELLGVAVVGRDVASRSSAFMAVASSAPA